MRPDYVSANKELPLKPLVAVFLGGTSGIGEHTAYALAKYTSKPTFYIIARNADRGRNVVEKLKSINADGKYEFMSADATLIKDIDRVSEQIMQKEQKLNLLFMSPGFLMLAGRIENAEGNDLRLAVNYYGRWRMASNLLPLLQKGYQQDKDARVISVLAPGNEGPVQLDDLDLKHNFSAFKLNRHIVEFNSLAVERFADLYPNIAFSHVHPGFVNTDILSKLPWAVRVLAKPLGFLFDSPESAGERFAYFSTNQKYATGAHILDRKDVDLTDYCKSKGYLSKDLQETVWKHSEELFKKSLDTYKSSSK